MKVYAALGGLLILGVVACGGGGSSSPSGIVPTTVPSAPVYTLSLSISGGLEPRSASARWRKPQTVSGLLPVLLVEPDAATTTVGLNFSFGADSALATAVVSPLPPAAPSFASTTAQVTLSTPSPNAATPAPGTYQQVISPNVADTTPVNGSFNVTLPSAAPVSTSVFIYKRVTLGCATNPSQYGIGASEYVGGIKFINGEATPETSPAASDLYISGPNCFGNFASAETENTLHYPGGGVYLPDSLAFNLATTANWSNAGTSNTTAAMTDGATPLLGYFTIRTIDATPNVVVIDFRSISAGGPNRGDAQMSGGFKECGFDTDGAC